MALSLSFLLEHPPVLFDGSNGTELQRRGLPPGSPSCLWNLERPEEVDRLHREYIAAGSKVIGTNTFAAGRILLGREGLEARIGEVNRGEVRRALAVAGDNALVAGSVSPLGALLEPYGELPVARGKEVFEEQIRMLAESGVHLILVETMISLDEAVLAVETARNVTGLPIAATMTFELHDGIPHTPFGESPGQIAPRLLEAGATIIGSNCGTGFDDMLVIARAFRATTDAPLLIQPNAGMPILSESEVSYPGTPAAFGEFAVRARDLGVSCIGGCCGTSPDHIREAYRRLCSTA